MVKKVSTESDVYNLLLKHIKQNDHSAEVLGEIKRRGDRNIVVTNTQQKHVNYFLGLVKMRHLFDEYIGISKHQEREGLNSAEHKAQRILKYCNGKGYDQIVMIGDSESDITAGKIAGATTFMYDPWNRHLNTKADYRIKDLRKILKVYK
ncbi:HAD family hydrolase, partial [Candidatus Micrarchaeota archaeon]|nr:HAD family hydrolase [Candidatus Micrarchaeota archaeon]